MRILVSVMVVLAVVSSCAAQVYSGPNRIGPFHIDRNTRTRVLFKELGLPSGKGGLYCYQTADRKAFVYVETIDSEPENVGDVLLSDFPNCVHKPIQTAESFRTWKTDKGIGLGSSEAEVLKAYGKPLKEHFESKDGRWVGAHLVRGFRAGEKSSRLADFTLFYNGDTGTDLRAAEFGIRDGKVVWIWLNQNE